MSKIEDPPWVIFKIDEFDDKPGPDVVFARALETAKGIKIQARCVSYEDAKMLFGLKKTAALNEDAIYDALDRNPKLMKDFYRKSHSLNVEPTTYVDGARTISAIATDPSYKENTTRGITVIVLQRQKDGSYGLNFKRNVPVPFPKVPIA